MSILTLATVLSQARTLLNDDTVGTFPDPVLIPKIQIAHQELQTALWDCGSPIIRKISAGISIPANTTSLQTTGSMPADLLVPFKMSESNAVNGPWTPMTEVYFISDLQNQNPPLVPGATLTWWSWIGDDIVFLGSTNARYIQVVYRRSLTIPAASADSLGVPFAEQYLAPRAAAIAGGSLNNPDSLKILTDMANTNLTKVISANRGKQMPAVKP
jgi:hypothetical protein